MILLDTCVLLWLSENPPRLPAGIIQLIRQTPIGKRYVSAITAFEIGVKYYQSKLHLPLLPRVWFSETVSARGLTVLPVNERIAFRATALPALHKDPADRILIASALEFDLVLLSPDKMIWQYSDVKVQWDK